MDCMTTSWTDLTHAAAGRDAADARDRAPAPCHRRYFHVDAAHGRQPDVHRHDVLRAVAAAGVDDAHPDERARAGAVDAHFGSRARRAAPRVDDGDLDGP